MENKVILVDLWDKPVGELEKSKAHTSPVLHRAFSVFLYHDDKMLIQQRARHKYHSGGLWANSCCSHPRPGESLIPAAASRLKEEAGITCNELEELFSFSYLAKFTDKLYEYEYDHVLLGQHNGPCHPNPDEVAQMQWISFSDLLQDMTEQPLKYAPWFLICAPKVIQIAANK